jgi:Mlc titration factor MtfA (ptsG expression regulator)
MAIAYEFPKVAHVLGVSQETLMAEMMTQLIEEKTTESEKKIGKLHFEDRTLQQKYGVSLEELKKRLDELEGAESYEGQTIEGIPVLEAVADTRAWEHVVENMAEEEKRLMELMRLTTTHGGESR